MTLLDPFHIIEHFLSHAGSKASTRPFAAQQFYLANLRWTVDGCRSGPTFWGPKWSFQLVWAAQLWDGQDSGEAPTFKKIGLNMNSKSAWWDSTIWYNFSRWLLNPVWIFGNFVLSHWDYKDSYYLQLKKRTSGILVACHFVHVRFIGSIDSWSARKLHVLIFPGVTNHQWQRWED